jgi:hypothetical protein
VWDIGLWLLRAVAAALPAEEVTCKDDVYDHEYCLHVAQAHETLDKVRSLLLVRTHLYKLKDAHTWGVRANMRSADKIVALNDCIKCAAAGYRVVRKALVVLGRTLKRREWEWQLHSLCDRYSILMTNRYQYRVC